MFSLNIMKDFKHLIITKNLFRLVNYYSVIIEIYLLKSKNLNYLMSLNHLNLQYLFEL